MNKNAHTKNTEKLEKLKIIIKKIYKMKIEENFVKKRDFVMQSNRYISEEEKPK